jgi:hypothetical protein
VISVGGSKDLLLVGMILESELMTRCAHEYGVPGAPVLFGAQNNQLLCALFADKDDSLGITLHVYLLGPFSGHHNHVLGKLFACLEINFTYSPEGHKMKEVLH